MAETWREEITRVAGTDLAIIKGGSGRPLLVLHEELGHPGWLNWHTALARDHAILIPIQPGVGKSPRLEWIRSIHELGLFYNWVLREIKLAPIDVIGFSTGGWVAAEMASADPALIRKMVLVAPAGVRPPEGEIMDIFAVSARTELNASVYDRENTPEFTRLYGGERTPEQFEAFEEARTENVRLAWDPILHNTSLPHFLGGVRGVATQIIWGREDAIIPVSAADAYRAALKNTDVSVAIFDHCGHRPEIEQAAQFIKLVSDFLE
jgi:pimeloyl-ACP methyl ester carboxylesterase